VKIRPTRRTVLSVLPAGLTAFAGMIAFAAGATAAPAATTSSAAAAPATSAAAPAAPATTTAPAPAATTTTTAPPTKAPTTTAPKPSAPSTAPTKRAAAPAAASLSTKIVLFTVNGKGASSSTQIHGGDVLVYQLTVTNTGDVPGTITLTETVPANTTYAATQTVWSGCAKGSKAGTTCTQTATLAAGGKGTTTFTVAAVDPLPSGTTSITNTVRASTGTCAACTASNAAASAAELHTTVTISSVNGHAATSATHLSRGDKVVYAVKVTNTGNSSGTTTVHETVPTHATFSGSGWSCASGATAGTSCTRAVTVAAGSSITASFQVTLTSYPGDTKTITDAASSSVGTCTACSASNRTVAFLVTTKSIFRVGTGLVSSSAELRSGDRVVYHITVTNTGGSTGSTTLTDTVPTNTSYVGDGQGWSCARHSSAGTSCTQRVSVDSDGKVVLRYTVLIGSSSGAAFSAITNSVSTSAGVCSGCSVTNAVAQEGTLANTGVDTAGESAIGVGLLGAGVLLTLVGRRRRTDKATTA
jgi:uncharacterized repeat protein (TIGR01451 family)